MSYVAQRDRLWIQIIEKPIKNPRIQCDITRHFSRTQGCPLSQFFASLVLHILLSDIDNQLRTRSRTRLSDHTHPGDENLGSLSQTSSFIDDTNMALACGDISWFIDQFSALGAPLGIAINPHKTKILTSTNSMSPLTNPSDTPPAASTFVSCAPRKSILRNLCCAHKKRERIASTPTFPPRTHPSDSSLPSQQKNKQASHSAAFHSLKNPIEQLQQHDARWRSSASCGHQQ
jgi:hypothetical protein